MTRKDTKSFLQLTRYITQEAKVGRTDPLFFSHNIIGMEPEEIALEMQQNYKFRNRVREDENSLLHYVLSFHKEDQKVLHRDVLTDIVHEFIDEFNPNGLSYGAMHSDQDHYHCHLILCANELESNELIYKRRHLSKEDKERPVKERNYKERTFEESKNHVRHFARERAREYAQQRGLNERFQKHGLYHSFDERYLTKTREGKKRSAAELDNIRTKNVRGFRQQKSRSGSKIQVISTDAIRAIQSASNFETFIYHMQQKYNVYETSRGVINGIQSETGKQYRFTTTLLPEKEAEKFKQLRKEYYRVKKLQKERGRGREGYNRDRRDGWSR